MNGAGFYNVGSGWEIKGRCIIDLVHESFVEYGSDPSGSLEFSDDNVEGDVPTFYPSEKIRVIRDCGAKYKATHRRKGGLGEAEGAHVHFRGSGPAVIRCIVKNILDGP